jgi:adenosine/AMP kinase
MQVLQKLSPTSSRVYLGGSCLPNAIPTFNQLNAIRNIQMIFINIANPLKQIIILMRKGRIIPTLNGQIPLWKE